MHNLKQTNSSSLQIWFVMFCVFWSWSTRLAMSICIFTSPAMSLLIYTRPPPGPPPQDPTCWQARIAAGPNILHQLLVRQLCREEHLQGKVDKILPPNSYNYSAGRRQAYLRPVTHPITKIFQELGRHLAITDAL